MQLYSRKNPKLIKVIIMNKSYIAQYSQRFKFRIKRKSY